MRYTANRFEDGGLNEGSTYFYALQACNEIGCSGLSDETGGVTEISGQVYPPATPSLRAKTEVFWYVFSVDTVIHLTWGTVDGATIMRSIGE